MINNPKISLHAMSLTATTGLEARKPFWGVGGLRTTKAQTSGFVICFLESIISILAMSDISIF